MTDTAIGNLIGAGILIGVAGKMLKPRKVYRIKYKRRKK